MYFTAQLFRMALVLVAQLREQVTQIGGRLKIAKSLGIGTTYVDGEIVRLVGQFTETIEIVLYRIV